MAPSTMRSTFTTDAPSRSNSSTRAKHAPRRPLTTQGKIARGERQAEQRRKNEQRGTPTGSINSEEAYPLQHVQAAHKRGIPKGEAAAAEAAKQPTGPTPFSDRRASKPRSLRPPGEMTEEYEHAMQRSIVQAANRLALRKARRTVNRNPLTTQQKIAVTDAMQAKKDRTMAVKARIALGGDMVPGLYTQLKNPVATARVMKDWE